MDVLSEDAMNCCATTVEYKWRETIFYTKTHMVLFTDL